MVRDGALRRALEGDLDNIVLKALRREPERRYQRAAELSDDIERHLTDRPVSARPDTLTYRSRKFLKRNRTFIASAAAGAAIVFGLVMPWARFRPNTPARVATADSPREHLNFEKVAALGDPAPESGRVLTKDFEPYAAFPNGDLLFAADISQTGIEGVFLRKPGREITAIAYPGYAIPGGVVLAAGVVAGVGVNNSGDAAFGSE